MNGRFGRNGWNMGYPWVLFTAIGCGTDGPSTYPVRGTVTYPDGSPVTAGMVEFESTPIPPSTDRFNARGRIHDDGSYSLSTFRKGDGAVAGHHRVVVQEFYPEADLTSGTRSWRPSVDPRYRKYEDSGLAFEVATEANEIDIVVTRPGAR